MSYDRRYKISLDGESFIEGGAGRQLRITFSLSSGFDGRVGTGDLAIFNLTRTSAQIPAPGTIVTVEAGYASTMGIIDTGRIANVLNERIGVDTMTRAATREFTKCS